jgi:predicted P-loop ATPase
VPFVIRLTDRRVADCTLQPLRVKLDPGSKTTGLALVRESEAIKAWISRREEEVRGLYKEFHRKYPRRLVMIGTGNKEFLSDETGERRWLPIRVGRSNMPALTEDVNQLWAEGVHKWRAGGVQWREAQHLAVDEHADFKVADEWEGVVRQWLGSDAMDGADGPKRGE